MTQTLVGRLSPEEAALPVIGDVSNRQVLALTTKVDQLTDALKAIAAKLDGDSGVNSTNYASTITDALSKLQIFI